MFRRVVVLGAVMLALLAQGQKSKKFAPSIPTPVPGELLQAPGWPLYYADLRVGDGSVAEQGTRVKVHYTGWLEDGKVFDSSVGSKPYSFTVGAGKVIRGWDIGVEGMKVGGRRQLHIPASMGYGMAGSPPSIPPNAKLIFEIELLEVSSK